MANQTIDIQALATKYNGDKAKVLGALLLEGVAEKVARDLVRDAGLGRSRSGFRAELYERLAKGPLAKDEFQKLLKGQSANVIKHETHYEGIVDLVNAVWVSAKKAK